MSHVETRSQSNERFSAGSPSISAALTKCSAEIEAARRIDNITKKDVPQDSADTGGVGNTPSDNNSKFLKLDANKLVKDNIHRGDYQYD